MSPATSISRCRGPVPFQIERRSLEHDCVELAVAGELDYCSSSPLAAALEATAGSRGGQIVNLDRCELIDLTAAGLLVRGERRSRRSGCPLTIAVEGAATQVQRLLAVTGLEERPPFTATVAEALAEIAQARDQPDLSAT